ncbi:hypothetical protein B0J11DRAFT_586519 [Dendryphion nanum]|uniref:Uncharacterized protein n=1 Tax=Dendryphion nanum TaxID=256645 RepID=A0A9P9I735_9PLEO|nr:hypothetical protein B0J11DRAFT_586519 [Dendryphion nanum]
MKFGSFCVGLIWFNLSLAIQLPGYETDLQIKLNKLTKNHDYNGQQTNTGENTEDSQWPARVAYTSVLRYDFDVVAFTDSQLAGLVIQAWDEMDKLHADWIKSCKSNQKNMKKIRPGMMTAIAFGKTVYLGSSIKQNADNILLSHSNGVLTRAVTGCRIAWLLKKGVTGYGTDKEPSKSHRSGASCGEIITASMVLQDTKKLPMDHVTEKQKVRIISYGSGKGYNTTPKLWAPCNAELYDPTKDKNRNNEPYNAMGCYQMSEWQRLTIIDPDKQTITPMKVTAKPLEPRTEIDLNDVWTITTEEVYSNIPYPDTD